MSTISDFEAMSVCGPMMARAHQLLLSLPGAGGQQSPPISHQPANKHKPFQGWQTEKLPMSNTQESVAANSRESRITSWPGNSDLQLIGQRQFFVAQPLAVLDHNAGGSVIQQSLPAQVGSSSLTETMNLGHDSDQNQSSGLQRSYGGIKRELPGFDGFKREAGVKHGYSDTTSDCPPLKTCRTTSPLADSHYNYGAAPSSHHSNPGSLNYANSGRHSVVNSVQHVGIAGQTVVGGDGQFFGHFGQVVCNAGQPINNNGQSLATQQSVVSSWDDTVNTIPVDFQQIFNVIKYSQGIATASPDANCAGGTNENIPHSTGGYNFFPSQVSALSDLTFRQTCRDFSSVPTLGSPAVARAIERKILSTITDLHPFSLAGEFSGKIEAVVASPRPFITSRKGRTTSTVRDPASVIKSLARQIPMSPCNADVGGLSSVGGAVGAVGSLGAGLTERVKRAQSIIKERNRRVVGSDLKKTVDEVSELNFSEIFCLQTRLDWLLRLPV